MKNSQYSGLILLMLFTLTACQKPATDKPIYDNSNSFVTWTISPISGLPSFINGWNFNQQYCEPRMAPTANMSPYYGYPIGALTPEGKLSFDYSSGNTGPQIMSLFLNSSLKIKGTGSYAPASCFDNGYVARVEMNGVAKNLYLCSENQSLSIDSYNPGFSIENKVIVTVLKGSFQLTVSDCPDGGNAFTIMGSFQLPVPSGL